jgi:hypothetical protein
MLQSALRPVPPVPGYGREPVGNGQAAAGFSAVRALPADGDDAGVLAIGAAGLAAGLAASTAFFFFPAFFFLLADFFLRAAFFLPAFTDFFFFFDPDFFFFFFLPPFFAFFFAIFRLLQGC